MSAATHAERMAVYDGRTWLGSITIRDDGFEAALADRRALGTFASFIEAADAISNRTR